MKEHTEQKFAGKLTAFPPEWTPYIFNLEVLAVARIFIDQQGHHPDLNVLAHNGNTLWCEGSVRCSVDNQTLSSSRILDYAKEQQVSEHDTLLHLWDIDHPFLTTLRVVEVPTFQWRDPEGRAVGEPFDKLVILPEENQTAVTPCAMKDVEVPW